MLNEYATFHVALAICHLRISAQWAIADLARVPRGADDVQGSIAGQERQLILAFKMIKRAIG
jgi:hypothetical protein